MAKYEILYNYITEELHKRYPKASNIISNQPIYEGIQVDFAIDLPDEIIFVEAVQRRASITDIMRLYYLKEMYHQLTNVNKNKRVTVLLCAPVIPSRVRELASKSGVECLLLPRDLMETSPASIRKIRLTTDSAWEVVLHFIWNRGSNIRQAAIETNTSYSWTHTIVKQMLAKGILEKVKGEYRVTDIDRLLNGVSWERPLEDLILKEWTVVSTTIEEVLEDIKDGDPDAIITGHVAVGDYFDYIRRFDLVQIYSKRLADLEYHLGRSKDGVKVMVLKSDRRITGRKAGRSHLKGLNVVDPGQLILDLAGMGYGARDILKKVIEVGPGGS